jgi:hypothetical protein
MSASLTPEALSAWLTQKSREQNIDLSLPSLPITQFASNVPTSHTLAIHNGHIVAVYSHRQAALYLVDLNDASRPSMPTSPSSGATSYACFRPVSLIHHFDHNPLEGVSKMTFSRDGSGLAIRSRHGVYLIETPSPLPRVPIGGLIECSCLALLIAPMENNRPSVISTNAVLKWHPLSSAHLCVALPDRFVVYNVRASRDADPSEELVPEQSYALRHAFIDFTFGCTEGSIFHGGVSSMWHFAIVFVTVSGDLYALTPVVPADCLIDERIVADLMRDMDNAEIEMRKEYGLPTSSAFSSSSLGVTTPSRSATKETSATTTPQNVRHNPFTVAAKSYLDSLLVPGEVHMLHGTSCRVTTHRNAGVEMDGARLRFADKDRPTLALRFLDLTGADHDSSLNASFGLMGLRSPSSPLKPGMRFSPSSSASSTSPTRLPVEGSSKCVAICSMQFTSDAPLVFLRIFSSGRIDIVAATSPILPGLSGQVRDPYSRMPFASLLTSVKLVDGEALDVVANVSLSSVENVSAVVAGSRGLFLLSYLALRAVDLLVNPEGKVSLPVLHLLSDRAGLSHVLAEYNLAGDPCIVALDSAGKWTAAPLPTYGTPAATSSSGILASLDSLRSRPTKSATTSASAPDNTFVRTVDELLKAGDAIQVPDASSILASYAPDKAVETLKAWQEKMQPLWTWLGKAQGVAGQQGPKALEDLKKAVEDIQKRITDRNAKIQENSQRIQEMLQKIDRDQQGLQEVLEHVRENKHAAMVPNITGAEDAYFTFLSNVRDDEVAAVRARLEVSLRKLRELCKQEGRTDLSYNDMLITSRNILQQRDTITDPQVAELLSKVLERTQEKTHFCNQDVRLASRTLAKLKDAK